jgi:hypothetical protein
MQFLRNTIIEIDDFEEEVSLWIDDKNKIHVTTRPTETGQVRSVMPKDPKAYSNQSNILYCAPNGYSLGYIRKLEVKN